MSDQPRKGGRPREDRFLRRMEIFHAVAPLILERGVAGLTMEAAARAASLSRSGLYHYFGSKRQLVLFPLLPEVCEEAMRRFQRNHAHLWSDAPDRYLQALIDDMAETAVTLRPAVQAAIELGADEARAAFEQSLTTDLRSFVAMVRQTVAGGDLHDPDRLARAIRREILGAILDRSTPPGELATAIHSLIHGTPLTTDRPEPPASADTTPVRPPTTASR